MQAVDADATLEIASTSSCAGPLSWGAARPANASASRSCARPTTAGSARCVTRSRCWARKGSSTIKPRSGYFVTSVTLKELRDLLDMREVLEVAVVERAAVRITERRAGGASERPRGLHGRRRRVIRPLHRRKPPASTSSWRRPRGTRNWPRASGGCTTGSPASWCMRHAGGTQHETHAAIIAASAPRDVAAARQAMLDEVNWIAARRSWTASCRAKARAGRSRRSSTRRAASSGLASHLSGVQALVRRFGDRLHHRPEVLHRRVQLHVMRRPEDQAATLAHRAQPRQHFRPHRLGRSRTAASPVRRWCPRSISLSPYSRFSSAGSMHTGWTGLSTSSPISINSGMIVADVAVRVIRDLHLRIDRLELSDEVGEPRLEVLAPVPRRDQH